MLNATLQLSQETYGSMQSTRSKDCVSANSTNYWQHLRVKHTASYMAALAALYLLSPIAAKASVNPPDAPTPSSTNSAPPNTASTSTTPFNIPTVPTAAGPGQRPGKPYSYEAGLDGVNLFNGNKLTTIPLVTWNDRGGMPVGIALTHNSESQRNSELGPQWTETYDATLYRSGSSGPFTLTWGDETTYQVAQGTGGSTTTPAGAYDLIKAGSVSGTYVLTMPDRDVYTFTAEKVSGQTTTTWGLTMIQDQNGNAITVARDSANGYRVTTITDTSQRTLKLAYNSNGTLNTITDPLGRIWTITYNSGHVWNIDLPAPVAGANQPCWAFQYTSNGTCLRAVTSPSGLRTSNYTYNSDNSIATATDAVGNSIVHFTYNPTASPANTVVTDANGNATTYTYANDRISSVTDALGYKKTYGYDNYDNATSIEDARNKYWYYAYDGGDNITKKTDPNSNVFSATYSGVNQLLTSTVTPQSGTTLTTNYSYDAQYNRQTLTDPAGDVTSKSAYPSSNTTAYGLPDTFVDPNGNTTTYNSYDSYGDPTGITDGAGRKSTYTYNSLGWPLTKTDALEHTTQFSYDNWGRVINILFPDNTSKRLVYDNDSNVVEVQNPDAVSGQIQGAYTWTTGVFGSPNIYFYGSSNSGYVLMNNAGAVNAGSAGLGNESQYGVSGKITLSAWVYPDAADNSGGPYDIIDQAAPQTRSSGNENYLRISGGQLQFGAWNGTTDSNVSYTLPSGDYNATELVTGTCDGKTWTLYVNGTKVASAAASFGALNCSEPWSVAGSPTQGNYYRGGVDEVRIYNRALTSSEVSQLDAWNPTSTSPQAAPSDGLSHYWNFNEGAGTLVYDSCHSDFRSYDADNRLTQETNGRGDVVNYLYDGYDPRNTSNRQFGLLSGVTNGNGTTTYYGYDARNEKNYDDYADGTTDSVTYDGNGNLITRVDRDGNKITYSYDPANRLTNITYPASPQQGVIATPNVAFTYDGANRMVYMSDSQQGNGANPNQTNTYWGYDNASRINQMNTPSEFISYSYYPGSQLKQRTFDGNVSWNYSYDGDNELNQVKTPETSGTQLTMGLTYNSDGTVQTKSLVDGSTVNYGYDAAKNITAIYTNNPSVSGANGTLQAQIGYKYDDGGNITRRSDFTGGSNNAGDQQSQDFEYDGANELMYEDTISTSFPNSSSSYPHDFWYSYTYDHNQNRLSKDFGPGSNGSGDYVENYAYNVNNDELTGNGPYTYSYNNDGDLTTVYNGSTQVSSYGYDMQNRLASYSNSQGVSGSGSMSYTGLGGSTLR